MKQTRREFILGGMAAGAALPLLRSPLTLAASSPLAENRIIVFLQMRGGNDWMNTVIAAQHPVYQAARPKIKITPAQGLPVGSAVNGALYLHPAMVPFKRLWDAGKLALISGVGYPNHNFSHFRSEDVWYSADPTATGVSTGWLARYFRDVYQGGFSIPALLAQSGGNPSFTGLGVPSITNPALFAFATDPSNVLVDGATEQALIKNNVRALRPTAHPDLLYVANAMDSGITSSALLQQVGTAYTPKAPYPAAATNSLVTPLQLVARYITGGASTPGSGLDTRCYYLSTPQIGETPVNFDTHAQQGAVTGSHAILLDRVTSALEAFLNDIAAWGHSQRVVVVLWTEFTRRVGENGSGGTDHGNAGGVMVCGAPVIGGHYGVYPDLNPITPPFDQQNLAPTTDLRNVYSALLSKWWGANPQLVIPNWTPNYANLGFLP